MSSGKTESDGIVPRSAGSGSRESVCLSTDGHQEPDGMRMCGRGPSWGGRGARKGRKRRLKVPLGAQVAAPVGHWPGGDSDASGATLESLDVGRPDVQVDGFVSSVGGKEGQGLSPEVGKRENKCWCIQQVSKSWAGNVGPHVTEEIIPGVTAPPRP